MTTGLTIFIIAVDLPTGKDMTTGPTIFGIVSERPAE
jgi:hypothetical protein